jgi:hypothetical protein
MEEIKETLLKDLKAIPKQAFQDCLENCTINLEQCMSSGSTFSETGAVNS